MTFELSNKSVTTITMNDFEKICRTCLCEDNLCPIKETFIGQLSTKELLNYSISLRIDSNDTLPPNICSACINELFRFYNFKKRCRDNDTILRLLIQNTLRDDVKKWDENDDHSYNIQITTGDADDVDDHNQPDETKEEIQNKIRRMENGGVFKENQCRSCLKEFQNHTELEAHKQETKHGEMKTDRCEICNKIFTRSKLRQHMRIHTKEKPYKCEFCLQSFSVSGNLKRHRMRHTGERPHICGMCGKGFIQSTSLKVHEKVHEDEYRSKNNRQFERRHEDIVKFSCHFCGRGFKRLTPFKAHLDKHKSSKRNSLLKQTATNDTNSKNDQHRAHLCNICKRGYKTKHLLKAHQLTHGEKTFLCSDCGKSFARKAALQSHLKIHTGEKPHTCVICKKSFAHVGSFDSHMLIHTGHKPYSCNYCTKSFTQLSHLTYHLRTHSGERPYQCSYCGKCFALKGNLTVHVRTHTGETPYLCCVCGKGFYDSSSLKKHRRHHYKEESEQRQQQEQLKQQEEQQIEEQHDFRMPAVIAKFDDTS